LADRPLHRFTRENRLLQAAAFSRVFKKAERSRDKWFTVLSRPNDRQVARLGLGISKKHCRHATGRNRIKRLVRESFRRHKAQLAGLDIVVLSQPVTKDASNQALFDSLEKHWQRCARRRPQEGGQD
jgi:ribonuclease P protein component